MYVTKKTRLKIKLNSILMLCLFFATTILLAWLTYKNSVEYDPTINTGDRLAVVPPLEMGSDRPVAPGSAGGLSYDLLKELRLLMIGMNQ